MTEKQHCVLCGNENSEYYDYQDLPEGEGYYCDRCITDIDDEQREEAEIEAFLM